MPVGKHRPRLLIISPVRDEEAFLSSTIKSVVSQTIRPCTWIIVDDGSTDNTVLVSKGSTWRYLDDGSNQGTAWREHGRITRAL